MLEKKAMVISLTNFKGGTGKTTTTVNLSHGLADRNYKVLVVDLDAQSNLTDLMGAKEYVSVENCISQSLRNKKKKVDVFNVKKNLDIIGSNNLAMIGIETELQNLLKGSERQLERCLNDLMVKYDFIILDNAPALNALTVNSYNISDRIIVPVVSDYMSLPGFYVLENRLKSDLEIEITDIIISRNENTVVGKEVNNELSRNRGNLLFETTIPKNVAIIEQGISKQSIYDYAPNSIGAVAYNNLVDEFIKRIEVK